VYLERAQNACVVLPIFPNHRLLQVRHPGGGWIEYDVNKVAHSGIDDSSGHKWDCQSYTYDELPNGSSPSLPEAGLVTTTNSYSSTCAPPTFGTPMITTYTGYDAYGNLVATFDGVGAANSQSYISGGLSTPVTIFFFSDALGNLLATFNNTQGAAAIQGNKVYSPYGNSLYSSGSMDTAKGYTGQYADTLTGLDYYVSRYYDPVVGIFLSADDKEGNAQGMNPYAYVDGNPETLTDPGGQMYYDPGRGGNDSQQKQEQYAFQYVAHGGLGQHGLPVLLDLYLYDRTGWRWPRATTRM
jgi:RHS repeat-associated protein